MIFLFPRWDMLIPWRVPLFGTKNTSEIPATNEGKFSSLKMEWKSWRWRLHPGWGVVPAYTLLTGTFELIFPSLPVFTVGDAFLPLEGKNELRARSALLEKPEILHGGRWNNGSTESFFTQELLDGCLRWSIYLASNNKYLLDIAENMSSHEFKLQLMKRISHPVPSQRVYPYRGGTCLEEEFIPFYIRWVPFCRGHHLSCSLFRGCIIQQKIMEPWEELIEPYQKMMKLAATNLQKHSFLFGGWLRVVGSCYCFRVISFVRCGRHQDRPFFTTQKISWQWKIIISNKRYWDTSSNWLVFHCYVRFQVCNPCFFVLLM